MAVEMMELPPAGRRRVMMDALGEIARGELIERLRLDAAARILDTARRARALGGQNMPLPEALAGWDAEAVTAREHAESLSPVRLDGLLREAPRWAAALLRGTAARPLAA
ncbi:hypothetical protein [Pseudoroseomonas sp. WGS1072]|uniref:hypothetical protein n=1 Tax=Roseomonas sp. WGS1072 TaxID=3366816 RepID=UPI003BF1300E